MCRYNRCILSHTTLVYLVTCTDTHLASSFYFSPSVSRNNHPFSINMYTTVSLRIICPARAIKKMFYSSNCDLNSCKFCLPNRHMLHYHSKQFRTIQWSMPLGFVTLHVHSLNYLNLVDDRRIHIHMTNNNFSYIHFVTTPSLQLITNDAVYD